MFTEQRKHKQKPPNIYIYKKKRYLGCTKNFSITEIFLIYIYIKHINTVSLKTLHLEWAWYRELVKNTHAAKICIMEYAKIFSWWPENIRLRAFCRRPKMDEWLGSSKPWNVLCMGWAIYVTRKPKTRIVRKDLIVCFFPISFSFSLILILFVN